jgi:hypothetical protein
MRGVVYYYRTPVGLVTIRETGDRGIGYRLMLDDDDIGGYASCIMAADDAAGGHTFGTKLKSRMVPEDLAEWQRGPAWRGQR